VAVLLSIVAGLAGSVQVAVSGAFGRRIGVLEATAFGSITAALIVCAVLLVARQGFGNLGASVREPAWLWLGGLMGAIVVTTITFTAPRIGTFATIGLLIAGRLAMGVLIDAFGLFGLEKIPVTPERIIGPRAPGRGRRARPEALRTHFGMTRCRRGVLGECEARTQGALVFEDTGATEDAESRRPGCSGDTRLHFERGSNSE
jgi:bacterial/archaeal transporter family-2 protein